ncbi:MAG: ROK family protein [Actinobacteria bacterium]|nr:MAG: ROK family protein [Actinomycetota bacterium]
MRRFTVPTVQAGHAIGVDLGGTKILAGVVARDGSVVRRHERPTPQDSQEHVLAELEAAVAELLDDSVEAVGFGAPSPIDQARGVVVRCVSMPLENAPLRDRMHERFGVPVGLDNDANAAAIGEWRAGAGRGEDDVVMLTLGTGVGGGVISGGRPFRGWNGAGAELGHVVIVHEGRPCQGACTGRGHLEAYVSGTAVTEAAREEFGPSADAHRLVRLANEGEAKAEELLAEVARYLGSGIGSFVNVFGPEAVILGGGFGVAAYDYLRGPAEEVTRREALEPMRSTVRFAKAELGTAAGLIGAGFVGFEALDA